MSRNGDLFAAAAAVRKNAHAPYSDFRVGAAVLADNGKTYVGCNVENAAYPQGMCAEAGAIAAMVSDGGRQIEQICIVGDSDNPVTPCGGCRQKIREFASPDATVLVGDLDGVKYRFSLEELLPVSFGPDNLKG
jgi:cytidine deaminase